jgi:hypothetical protein
MKLLKIIHNEGAEPDDIQTYVWKEGTEEELRPVAKRLVEYLLPVFEGLTLIAAGFTEEGKPFKTFANGLSNSAYWVRVTVAE